MLISRRTFGQGVGATMLMKGGLAHAYATELQRPTAKDIVERIVNKVAAEGSAFEIPGVGSRHLQVW
ncbi:hypothetical protein [Acidisarcina polymorpha]|nr:hypothetical protein [Acidisarcina polymorpha]